jgi:hypothetical protein
LFPHGFVGRRDYQSAKVFIQDLADRLAHRVQLTTDGHKAYLNAVEDAFGPDIDYAMLIKLYGNTSEGEKRYSPAQCTGEIKERIQGNPDNEARFNKLCRKAEPHNENEHEKVYQTYKRILKEG